MEKIRISKAILVEGKYDKIKLSNIADALIITTDGFSVFNNAEKRSLIKKLAEKKGLLILTDSDKAGFFIRGKLKGYLKPEWDVQQVYVPRIEGKEKRKTSPSKEKLLGVEGIDDLTLYDVLKRYACQNSAEPCSQNNQRLTKAYFYEKGLSGRENSAELRKKLCAHLDLPATLGANALLEAVNMLELFEKTEEFFDNQEAKSN